MSITLTVTAKGQVTLRREVLAHLRVRPGDKLDVDLLEEGRMQVRAKRGRSVASVFGMLERPGAPCLTIEELNESTASGWAGES